jgi:hypothetical protein
LWSAKSFWHQLFGLHLCGLIVTGVYDETYEGYSIKYARNHNLASIRACVLWIISGHFLISAFAYCVRVSPESGHSA